MPMLWGVSSPSTMQITETRLRSLPWQKVPLPAEPSQQPQLIDFFLHMLKLRTHHLHRVIKHFYHLGMLG